jgi:hypothetical protein
MQTNFFKPVKSLRLNRFFYFMSINAHDMSLGKSDNNPGKEFINSINIGRMCIFDVLVNKKIAIFVT